MTLPGTPAMTFALRLITILPALVALALLWGYLGRAQVIEASPQGALGCLSYTPLSADRSPADPAYRVMPGRIATDLAHVRSLSPCIRTYSSLGPQGEVVAEAAKAGLKVWLGIWISSRADDNAAEIAAAVKLARAYPQTVLQVVVGNEVLLRREMTPARLAAYIETVKAQVAQPVTYADIPHFWRAAPEVVAAVDRIAIHVLPYWDDPWPVSIDAVQAHVATIVEDARKAFPGKTLQIGEIGWPSAGRTRGEAQPGIVNQARFVREFAAGADAIGLPYNLIEALDQPWKRAPEGTVGGYWGLIDKDGHAKFQLTGPVSDRPDWKEAAAFAGIASVCVWALAWALGGGLPRLVTAGLAGAGLGSALWGLAGQIGLQAIPPWGVMGGAVLLTLAGVSSLLAALRIAGFWMAGRTEGRWAVLFRWAALTLFAVIALQMAVDGRHREFWTLAFLPLAFWLALVPNRFGQGRAEGWLAGFLIVAGPLAVDHIRNGEALIWAVLCLSFAWLYRQPLKAVFVRPLGGSEQ